MALPADDRFGAYEILAPLGSGGMGQVYRARDTRLRRDVALKLLPDDFSGHSDRLARFQREAEVLASLNDPHICTIFGVEESEGRRALILELVDGETLADRMRRKPLTLVETLAAARQIVSALGVAHDAGIIHRDLKPANIMLAPNGHVKVLDFGLATIVPAADVVQGDVETRLDLSVNGAIVGTVAYMSPEQAKGHPVDRSTDVWAFGCVLYEMLTGGPVFAGTTAVEVLESVFKSEPDWRRLPSDTPEAIRRLLRRCLQKELPRRLRDMRDASLELDDAQAPRAPDTAPIVQTGRWQWGRMLFAGGVGLLAVTAAAAAGGLWRRVPTEPELRFEITTNAATDGIREESSLAAISPDGLSLVFAATTAGQPRLWLRRLNATTVRPLIGTDRGELPFWSPDSRTIGFFADGELRRVDVDGGSLRVLAHAEAGAGGTWSQDGTILFSSNPGRAIQRIAAAGGPQAATTVFDGTKQASQSYPQFFADGNHFLYFVAGSPDASGVYIGQLDSMTAHRLVEADAPAALTSTGHVLFLRQGTLLAQLLDVNRLALTGQPIPVAEHLGSWVALSSSAAGPIVYRSPAAGSGQQQLVWVTRAGEEAERIVYPNSGGLGAALSHDGRTVATFKYLNGNMDIWSFERERRIWKRLTSDSGDDIFPVWSPDGARVAFGSNRLSGGVQNLYVTRAGDPPGSEELLFASSQIKFATDWSPDGRMLLYDQIDRETGATGIWALGVEPHAQPVAVIHTPFKDQAGQFSPDGQWIAYQSDRDGQAQIYVQAFQRAAESIAVSANGGTQVRWNPNGKELFYVAPDGQLMTVPLRAAPGGQALLPGKATTLFETHLRPNKRPQYMVASDGQSFVLNSIVNPTSLSPVNVILHWKPE